MSARDTGGPEAGPGRADGVRASVLQGRPGQRDRERKERNVAQTTPGPSVLASGVVFDPDAYASPLDLRATEAAIKFIKAGFQERLAESLNLARVSAPIAVLGRTGVNDHLDGIQKPVAFRVKALGADAEIVQSLAKWKRAALADYGFAHGEGLFTDMNAIRPDETLDNFHSIYVDQWDWERVISAGERTVGFLQHIVRRIYGAIRGMEIEVCSRLRGLPPPFLPEDITFVHSLDLEARFPDLSPRERESAICAEKGAVFVVGIGADLLSGQPHDGRAADYDDWVTEGADGKPGLNGDILVWYPLLECSLELSSMGIRVDKAALLEQLRRKGEESKLEQWFHRRLLQDELPLSVGGGIGQSRLCMLLLRKAHVGEVQCGIWPADTLDYCRRHGIQLL